MAIKIRAQKKKEEETRALESAKSNEQPSKEPNTSRGRHPSSRSPVPVEANQIFHWRGILLPQFHIPRWRKRNGVPTVVLKPIDIDARLIPTNNPNRVPEDVDTDSQGDHSLSEDSDAPVSGSDDNVSPDGEQGGRQKSPGRHDSRNQDDDDAARYDDADVSSLEVEGLSHDQNVNDWEFEKWGENLTKFVRSPFGPEGFLGEGWHGVKPLGRGGFAMAANMVIKQIGKRKTKKTGLFADSEERVWDAGRPVEVALMRFMKNKPNIVQIKGYRRYLDKEVHRIYMEYCPSGDLYGLISEYRTRRQFMPEAFICHVFLHLARACKSLTEPTIPEVEAKQLKERGQHEIVHRDIKPLNVFLGDLDNGQNRTGIPYPEIKLGDFGCGIFTGYDDLKNPSGYLDAGTFGYRSLEMVNFDNIDSYTLVGAMSHVARAKERFDGLEIDGIEISTISTRILGWTNIWGIGAVMFDIMTLKPVKNYMWQTQDKNDPNYDEILDAEFEKPNVRDGLQKTPYNSTLTKLVARCLADFTGHRPDAAELISRLENFVASEKDKWHDESVDAQQIPFRSFKDIPTGNWSASESQSDFEPPGSSFKHRSDEKERWDADRPERNNRRRKVRDAKNEERRNKRKRGEEDVSSDETGDPSTGARKKARAKARGERGRG
ncbi:MAG: hypothetical protein Q9168_003519 [Polycauliona sp. 1 TL-2023]